MLGLKADPDHRTAFLALATLYAVVVLSGLKTFALWDQVRLLLDADPLAVLFQLHPHGLRLLVVQPAAALARLGVDPDPAWSLCCLLLILAAALLCARAAALLCAAPAQEARFRTPALAMLAAISLGMNGRLIPAFAGLALAVAVLAEMRAGVARWTWFPGLGLALVLSSVSSGTLAVTAVAAITALFLAPMIRPTRSGLLVVAAASLVLTVGAGLVVKAGADKALAYFQGDVLAVLAHGPGGLVHPALALGALLPLGAAAWWLGRPALRPVRVIAWAAAAMGLFGWSTLAVGFIPGLGLLLAWSQPPAECPP